MTSEIYFGAYEDALSAVHRFGVPQSDRTGIGTNALFGLRMEFILANAFPLVTTKRIFWRGVVEELLWMLRGETNIASLVEQNVHIWDEWADEKGNLGPVYGAQWRSWRGNDDTIHDQIAEVISQIKINPSSRRLLVNTWNVAELANMALHPCHTLFQFHVADGKLDCQLYQRSGDMFLGIPFNIASYSLLTYLVAHVTGLQPGRFIHVVGDAHIYTNHQDQVAEQLSRPLRPAPKLHISCDPKDDLAEYQFGDFELVGYDPAPTIRGAVAV